MVFVVGSLNGPVRSAPACKLQYNSRWRPLSYSTTCGRALVALAPRDRSAKASPLVKLRNHRLATVEPV